MYAIMRRPSFEQEISLCSAVCIRGTTAEGCGGHRHTPGNDVNASTAFTENA